MDEFVSLFGNVTVSTIVQWIVAIGFLGMVYREITKYLKKKLEEEAETKKNMAAILDATKKIPDIEKKISSLESQQELILQRVGKVEEDAKRRERNTLRDRLLQSYRYYTSPEHNPYGEWTKMEADAFAELYEDYVEAGGNGYVHSELKPKMDRLIVIDMADHDSVQRLMQSRK